MINVALTPTPREGFEHTIDLLGLALQNDALTQTTQGGQHIHVGPVKQAHVCHPDALPRLACVAEPSACFARFDVIGTILEDLESLLIVFVVCGPIAVNKRRRWRDTDAG